jgi:hypothetical protein
MKKLYIILVFVFNVWNVSAQGLINLELYGGPTLTYLNSKNDLNPEGVDSESFLNAHLGANLLTRITDQWQMSLQGELFRSSTKITRAFPMQQQYSSKTLGNVAFGIRYNIKRGNREFFFQPSIGALPYREELQSQSIQQEFQRKVGLTIRGEAGMKVYNSKNNYFLFGLRHQQGLNPIMYVDFPDLRFSGNATYTGLVIGYGLNFSKVQK